MKVNKKMVVDHLRSKGQDDYADHVEYIGVQGDADNAYLLLREIYGVSWEVLTYLRKNPIPGTGPYPPIEAPKMLDAHKGLNLDDGRRIYALVQIIGSHPDRTKSPGYNTWFRLDIYEWAKWLQEKRYILAYSVVSTTNAYFIVTHPDDGYDRHTYTIRHIGDVMPLMGAWVEEYFQAWPASFELDDDRNQ